MARGREKDVESGADEGADGTGSEAGQASGAGVTGTSAAGASPGVADLEFVKGLIDAVDASGIDSLEISRAGTRVRISKTPPAGAAAPAYYAAPPHAPPPAPPAAPAAPASSPAPEAAPPAGAGGGGDGGGESTGLIEVKSPMVGTYYRAPAPEAPPYVEVGTRVTKGQTLCILEAMKLMNELESEVEGVVRQVLVDNAEPVEYGQVLFRIDPAG